MPRAVPFFPRQPRVQPDLRVRLRMNVKMDVHRVAAPPLQRVRNRHAVGSPAPPVACASPDPPAFGIRRAPLRPTSCRPSFSPECAPAGPPGTRSTPPIDPPVHRRRAVRRRPPLPQPLRSRLVRRNPGVHNHPPPPLGKLERQCIRVRVSRLIIRPDRCGVEEHHGGAPLQPDISAVRERSCAAAQSPACPRSPRSPPVPAQRRMRRR